MISRVFQIEVMTHLIKGVVTGVSLMHGFRKYAIFMILKGCVHYIFASVFMSKRALAKQGKMLFISLRNLFTFLR